MSNLDLPKCVISITAKCFWFGQGEWGMTEWDEEEERKRSVKFVDNVIPDTRAQLKVLSKSYQVKLWACIIL